MNQDIRKMRAGEWVQPTPFFPDETWNYIRQELAAGRLERRWQERYLDGPRDVEFRHAAAAE